MSMAPAGHTIVDWGPTADVEGGGGGGGAVAVGLVYATVTEKLQ